MTEPPAFPFLVPVLSEIARVAGETLDLPEVFHRIALAAGRVLTFDAMTVTLTDEGDGFVLYSIGGAGVTDETRRSYSRMVPRAEYSPGLWDTLTGRGVIDDVVTSCDRAFPRDRELSESGVRAMLRAPLRTGARTMGYLSLLSLRERAFRPDDLALLSPADRSSFSRPRAIRSCGIAGRTIPEMASKTSRTSSARARTGSKKIGTRRRERIPSAVSKVAPTETTVLLTGESGTGKEILARAIHRASSRASGPFVAINAAALPDQLLESELFGYERGAFTGATAAKPGRIEQAAGGTLFLDEAGEMSPAVQAKLLRLLQEREFQRLGGTKVLRTDARIVAATNRDLKKAIARGGFREDLFYRLSVFEIPLPPLRERVEDILPLTEVFLAELGPAIGRPVAGVSKEAKDLLLAYPWPGNVRELKNALERAAILCEGGLITAAHLPISVSGHQAARPGSPATSGGAPPFPPGGVDLESLEREYVSQALAKARFNKSKAARLLGLTRAQLYSRIEKYGLGGGEEDKEFS
jgi:transcriptional regulator with GAF, ATPase, and Fis domain